MKWLQIWDRIRHWCWECGMKRSMTGCISCRVEIKRLPEKGTVLSGNLLISEYAKMELPAAGFSVLFCKNFYSVFFDKNHIFNLGRKTVIICINGPAVVFIHIEFRRSLIDHWFNCEHHTWDQNHLAALWSNITYKWFLMEFQTDSMTADLFYDRISVFLCVELIA